MSALPDSSVDATRRQAPYLLFMLIASAFALALLAFESLGSADAPTKSILGYADLVLCALFFVDFLLNLVGAKDKRRYLLTWGWLDLLSCIPIVEGLRWGRAARIVRIIRLLRGVRSAKVLTQFVLEKRAQSGLLAASLLMLLLVTVGSVMVLHVERPFGEQANIRTAEDAVWWAVVTVTTVGYGDKFPVSTEGRLIASVLMIAGVGMFATLSGLIASLFLSPNEDKHHAEIAALRQELQELRELMQQIADQQSKPVRNS